MEPPMRRNEGVNMDRQRLHLDFTHSTVKIKERQASLSPIRLVTTKHGSDDSKQDSVLDLNFEHLKQRRWGREEDKEVFALLNKLLNKHDLALEGFLEKTDMHKTRVILSEI